MSRARIDNEDELYFAFDNCQHALCNAHHLRELQFVVEQYKQTWAEQMIQLLVDIKAEIDATSADQASLLPDRLGHFAQRYDELVAQGLDQLLRIVAMQTAMIKAISSKNRATRQR